MRPVGFVFIGALASCQLIGGMGERSTGGPCKADDECVPSEACSEDGHCKPRVSGATTGGSAGQGMGGSSAAAGKGGATAGSSLGGNAGLTDDAGSGGDSGSGGGDGTGGALGGRGGRPATSGGESGSESDGGTAGDSGATGGKGGRGGSAGVGGAAGKGGSGGMGGSSVVNLCPEITNVSATPDESVVGSSVSLAATITNEDGMPVPLTYAWQASDGSVDGATSPSASFVCTGAGTVTVTLDVTDTACSDQATTTVHCTELGAPDVVINEVDSAAVTASDWVELVNRGTAPADLGNFELRDDLDTNVYVIPAGTTLEPGEYLVIDEPEMTLAFAATDEVRFFDASGNLLDAYGWTAHATHTYGRCPNATGALTATSSSTKGTGNDCPALGEDWPGTDAVVTVDGIAVFNENLSGLTYEVEGSAGILWAVRNRPGALYRLVYDTPGDLWTPDTANSWSAGKTLHYSDGSGNIDAEGVTRAEWSSTAIYVSSERNNSAMSVSRPSILRYDVADSGSSLSATHEWNLDPDLPDVDPNLGPEAITWVPDDFLVAHDFVDEAQGHAYAPSEYPDHGTGLFFVGLEANGQIYAYALDHVAVTFTRIATITSEQPSVMSLEFDRDTGMLWAGCDDACNGQTNVLAVDADSSSGTFGRFQLVRMFARPSTMPNIMNEGFAITPQTECSGGQKPAFWADDAETDGHSLRRDTVPCAGF